MPRRRRREQNLERVLGTPALFATAYGNVGSSIYYALGLTAVYALGLTPVVFVVAGVIFAATAATYAEGTVRYPEAGGSSSFARHAYNELVSFGAAWAQMLVYIVTVATSAFFVPHYLSIFWGPLDRNPWDIIGGVIVIVVLVVLNTIGVQEATRVSVVLAVIDFGTQIFLVILGFVLVLNTHVLTANVHWGVAPTWARLAIAIPVAMLAYTGVETVSNLAEEARDPTHSVPKAYKLVAGAVFAIYFTLPLVALSAMPVTRYRGSWSTELARPPEQGGHANDPVLGIVDNLGVHGTSLRFLQIYVGILAATILFIATNAGVIGASRVTYSMATYRQIPEIFRRLHPRFKTPWLSLIIFAGIAPILVILPGSVTFVGALYSFGATLSFTVAHASIVALRYKDKGGEARYRAKPNLRVAGVDWPLFAIAGGVATGISFLVIVVQNPTTRWVGLSWLALGFTGYVLYRRRYVKAPLRETVKAPPMLGPAMALEYRMILSPLVDSQQSREAFHLACRLAAERRSSIVAMRVIVVPLELPLDTELPGQEALAGRLLDEAHDIGELYGVKVIERVARARHAGREIIEEAARRNAEIIVIGAPRLPHRTRRSAIFGTTVDYVLKHADCRVMVGAGRRAAA
jgi:basic amino acid/polyamine antiporter, APA family